MEDKLPGVWCLKTAVDFNQNKKPVFFLLDRIENKLDYDEPFYQFIGLYLRDIISNMKQECNMGSTKIVHLRYKSETLTSF